ncbi:S-layer homology domain-containing protein [Paenibacillus guangzhouensis]|uniref:S-layer homology domain-containing protein n=1 Tax=Paenibacillus guangzhouensis TaxID=1473112 RepID=UPI0012674B1C|nr:S-layer homology domain-containing protein [Paenibacillus guangzhouensis]
MSLKSKNNRRAVLIKKAAIATTLSVCLIQQVAAAESVKDGTSNSGTFSTSVNSSSQPAKNQTAEKKTPNISKDEAVAKIRDLFPQFKDAEVENVTLGDPNVYPPRNEMVWTIQWKYQIGNSGYGFGSRVDALTGEILQADFSPWSEVSKGQVKYPPTYSREQAKEIAEKLIGRIVPSIDVKTLNAQNNIMYAYNSGLFGPANYSFSYNIPVNGLPSDETINISVDGEGNIFSYSRSMSGLSYPSATPSITAEKAKSYYAELLKMELAYLPVGEPYGNSKDMMLAYQPANVQFGIVDAKSGKFVDPQTGKEAKPNLNTNTYKSITPTAKQYAAHQGGELTADQAKAIVLNVLKPPAENKRMNQNMQNDWNDPSVKIWYLSWDQPNPVGPDGFDKQFNARVNAKTGQIIAIGNPYMSYRNANTKEKKKPEISLTDAEKKANYWINLLYPDAAANLKLRTPSEQNIQNNGGFYFEYQQFLGDIPVNYNNVRIELGSRGELVNYDDSTRSIDREAMKALKPSITAEEARTAFLNQFEMQLQYTRVGPYDYNNPNASNQQEQRLVYSPKFNPEEKSLLNAVTGKFQSYWYQAGQNSAQTAKDIQGTASEAALTKLLQAGVLKPNEEGLVKPSQPIKLGEWMQWITSSVQPYASYRDDKPLFKDISFDSPYYSAASFFVEKKWLKRNPTESLRPETEITREQLAESVTRILQYEQLAKFLTKDVEVTQLQDAAEVQSKGAVALMLKLGVMNTDGGKFHPKSTITRAEAAETIMKLVELQGKIDTEIQR